MGLGAEMGRFWGLKWVSLGAEMGVGGWLGAEIGVFRVLKRAEIAMFENNIMVYKFIQDLDFFVTGGDDEMV
nr:coatomer subunit zeta-1-like [Tanacetum cinerariifolium]